MKKILTVILTIAVLGMFATSLFAADAQYVGAAKCKMCHNSAKSGKQFQIWSESKHAKAFETLATEEAKAIAAKMGIEDPQKSEKCLKCHTTGYGADKAMFAASFKMEEGVGCESCHGPGSEYKSMKVMKGIASGTMKGADYGLIEATEEQCKTCHNEESPTFKGFDYKTFWTKIAHPAGK
ncbi:MAG: cytochrome c family protein [Calditrichia bacterium]